MPRKTKKQEAASEAVEIESSKPKKAQSQESIQNQTPKYVPGKAVMGRPFTLTQDIHNMLVEAARLGLPTMTACDKARVSKSAFYVWRNRADELQEQISQAAEGNAEYPILTDADCKILNLMEDLKNAESEFIRECMESIKEAGTTGKQWQALAWTLERRFRNDFGRNIVEVTQAKSYEQQLAEIASN